ncbi:phage NinH family protein [Erwinia sp. PK3-005]
MNITIQTIPELLVTTRGNITELARQLNANRATVTKFIYDKNAERHAVVNGILMTWRGEMGAHKRGGTCGKE